MVAHVFPPPSPTVLAVKGSAADKGLWFPVRRVYCVGRNYHDHAVEMGGNPEREPPFFFHKPTDAAVDVSCEGSVLPFPTRTEDLHFEAELVVAIGKAGDNVLTADAPGHVWGYGVGVDLTRRDLQNQAKSMKRPWCTSKGFDASGPVGALVPASDFDPTGKTITLKVNGERRQHSTLDKMIWSCSEIVSHLSSFYRLEPGDIIFTGTPAGVNSLRPGDMVEAMVDGLPPCAFRVSEPLSPLKRPRAER